MNAQEFDTHLNVLGSPGLHRSARTGVTTPVDKIISSRVGRTANEVGIVNSYGVTAREMIIKASSLPAPLEKYDVVTIGGQEYVAEAVIPKLEMGTGVVMGWVFYSVGD